MKILFISLLRLGDILFHSQLISECRKKYPNCQIDFLIFQQFENVTPLIPQVDHWHFIDRHFIQDILVLQQQNSNLVARYLESVITKINQCSYDLVFNLTHNQLSFRLLDLIEAREKKGAYFLNGRAPQRMTPWLQYFDQNFSQPQGSDFHYVDLLHKMMDLPSPEKPQPEFNRSGPIYMQVLTSDSKKNWPLSYFKKLKRLIEIRFPNIPVQILCSPQERDQVLPWFQEDEIISPNLIEAFYLLKNSRLLISGDTSILHLATMASAPVVGLYIGSADDKKTGPWQSKALVLSAHVYCQPCVHSQNCPQAEHLCSSQLTPDKVMEEISPVLSLKSNAEPLLAGLDL